MNDKFKWLIASGEGLLPVRFGNSPQEVATIPELNATVQLVEGREFEKTEFRRISDPSISYLNNQAFYIAVTSRTSDVFFGDIDVFRNEPRMVLQAFEKANGSPGYVRLGQVVFQDLAISIEGMYDLHEDAYFDLDGSEQDDRLIILQTPETLEVMKDIPRTVVSFF